MTVAAGFDLGGTQLKYGLVDGSGTVLFKDRVDTPKAVEDLTALFGRLYREIKAKGPGPVEAVGFGIPGTYDLRRKRVLQSPNYPSLDGYDLDPALAREIDVPFRVDNDANMAAYGEWVAGAGRGVGSLVLLTIGTGIGGGVILGGRLWQGHCGYGGEAGHIIVRPDGERCACGLRGCLETEASAPAIVRKYRALSGAGDDVTAEDVYGRAKSGDIAARQAFAQAGYYLGIGLGIILNLLNPAKVLLGGGVMTTGEFLLEPAVAEARRRSYRQSFACASIERAALGNDAGLIGAAAWALAGLVRS
ncbi:MAG: ROK family protein [Candidatus Aminicenantes bacterium]|nr:ROK family protein [Candidatus Aminicenantes bacterium]